MLLDETAPVRREADDTGPWADGWRRLALAASMLVYPLVTVIAIAQHDDGNIALGFLLVGAFCVCYVGAALAAMRQAWRSFGWLFAAMFALFLGALPFAHAEGFFLCAVLVAVATFFLGRRAVPLVVVAVAASIVVPWLVSSWESGPGWLSGIMIVCTVLIVYAFSETVRANAALVEARSQVARLASESERARIARDLHDLLGHSLTAIAVKTDVAGRIAAKEESAALEEITAVGRLSRQALADVRAAVSGYREVTLATELARGRELLRASGIVADLPSSTSAVDPAHQELFGWAVREGLTNVARHSRAGRCTVTLCASSVEVRDDGIGAGADSGGPGNGLTMLRERVELAGGTVRAGPDGRHGWCLRASLDERTGTTP